MTPLTQAKTAFILSLLVGCRTPKIDVATEPKDADILLFDSRNNNYVSIGKSPLNIREKPDALQIISNNDIIALSVEKKGFIIERIFLDKNLPSDVALSIKLKKMNEWIDENRKKEQDKELDNVVREVQRIIATSRNQDYLLAHSNIISLISRYPDTPILWEIKGSIERLRNLTDEALKSYKKSISLGSNDPDIISAVKSMEGEQK
jgi:hypothetical protein